ncbi:MAG TPA: tetratricopeptide repeat protein [Terracidiphilus sp.]
MNLRGIACLVMACGSVAAAGQAASTGQAAGKADFKLVLANHNGQVQWKAAGFKITETSAKPDGREIGIRAQDASGRLSFLGFLFEVPEQGPVTSAKCRDGSLEQEKASDPTFKQTRMSEVARTDRIPVSVVDYSVQGKGGTPAYSVRGFVASGNICGDLEVYSAEPIRSEDPDLLQIFQSFQLDEHYQPGFNDVFFYAQVLANSKEFAAAGPLFERALTLVKDAKGVDTKLWRRMATEQAGMSYGISGDTTKARAIFEAAIANDPDYPMYYYNLACADAQEKNLAEARKHLQQAFDRKANTLPGESMPDPTTDDSFTPYSNDKDFWSFLEGLRSKK